MEDHEKELPNGHQPSTDLSEYTALNRFISTTTTASHAAPSATDKDSDEPTSHPPRWKFWRQFHDSTDEKGGGLFQTPSEWLDTDISSGLSEAEVDERRKKCGWNELASESPNKLLQFIAYFRGPILYVMELALFLAAGLRDWIDFGVIIGILMLNAIVGWYQEKQAADVVASLKGDLAMKAIVVRDGEEKEILAREVVVGDILILEEGNVIPAEARLICDYSEPDTFAAYREKIAQEGEDPLHEDGESSEDEHKHTEKAIVAADQSAITGESLAVDKIMGDVCYYTTSCKKGKAYAIVNASAKDSFVGRTASLVQTAKDQGHFKAVMDSIGTTLLVLVMFWILVAWIGGFYRHLRIATPENDDNNLLHWTLILLIVGVPVGLPVVTTTTLAVGAAFLARKKAVVQKLTAIESLAGVDVLCTDKTGTLTANKLSVREPYVASGVDVNWMFAVAAIASSHNTRNLDPIDRVTLLALRRYPKAREMLSRPWITEDFTPFDPVSKRITTTCTCEGVRNNKNKAQEFALRGFRCLAVAVKEGDKDWQFLGLYPMFDPPREDTAQTIAEAQNLGLSVKMLTGDSTAIAKETCKMLALGTEVYNSERLIGSPHHDLVERANGFAEVFPEHKYQVVELLQKRGHLTAMTGDGVNDAPSLKKSDCGIAVEGATEAAQAAADIVFLAPGLNTIVDAIKVSRQIFQRMKAYVQYRIALCLHLEIYLVTSMLVIKETIRADLIVFLALFADLATIAVAYDNAHYEPRPVEWQLPRIWVISVVLGVLLAAGTWIMRGTMFLSNGGIVENWGHPQGILFLEVALTENWLIFVTREAHTWPSWQLVGAILGVDIIATLFCVFGWLTGGAFEQTSPPDPATFSEGPTSIVTVIVVWGFSIGVVIVIATVYYLLSRITWLQNLGRANRSKEELKMERFLEQLFKLTVEREIDPKSENPRFVLKTRTEDIDADD
ncbi:plasma-membrane proton-e [Aspergillus violaceofuscus CBS 115571]|uniref:Plasma-membrane proton-e n=1 Tax=Aspergillus violaceofuscus (strain CBS 115571) TaxID=1450538 RepID=A0A2V5I093_ASPV1|nr:plasma-membrane proton-e [Aspergillus violaceofuscus CBS 115571]